MTSSADDRCLDRVSFQQQATFVERFRLEAIDSVREIFDPIKSMVRIGAMLGGLIGTRLGWGAVSQGSFDLRSVGIATGGAMILLLLGRLARRRK